jgi:hypothetical protein
MHNCRGDVQLQDDENLIVFGSSPATSPKTSPFNSRPSSAGARPVSAASGASTPASCLASSATPALSKRQSQRLEVNEKRKERSLKNIFSDPLIERSLGTLAEEVLKEDRAREFRDHILKVGGRFSRFSFKRKAISPDVVAPILTDFPPPRPSFAPLQSHRSILGMQPDSSQKEVAGPEIIEPMSPVRIAARSVDIKNMSLHSSIVGKTPNISVQSTPYIHAETCRPSSAASHFSHADIPSDATVLSLTGDGMTGRVVESCSKIKAPRSAYVTAGNCLPPPSLLPLSFIFTVQNGIFQTSAPFSFQVGEKLTFFGAHLPPQIVLGRSYTIASVAPLSFTLSNLKFDNSNCNFGIFQAVLDGSTHLQAMHTKDPSKDLCSIASCNITRSSTPSTGSSNHECQRTFPMHTARCTSGKRRISGFVTNINPLQMSNAHVSARVPVLFPDAPQSR